MKTIAGVIFALLCVSVAADAQFKSQVTDEPSAAQSLVHPSSINSFLGLLNPDNFMMRHNLSYSFMSFGGQSVSVASYTNSMFYKFSDPLNVQFDVTMQATPFGASGSAFQNSLNGVFLSRAQLNYRPWENFAIRLEYDRLPAGYFGTYGHWYNPTLGDF